MRVGLKADLHQSVPARQPSRVRRTRFDEDAEVLARGLLGQRLVRADPTAPGGRVAGVIVEVEAYLGPEDLACHTTGGRRTARNASMWLPAGHAYVYFVYGMHHCFNVVAGEGAAVLVRALRPTEGLSVMAIRRGLAAARRLCSGPARIAQALGIDRSLDGADLRASGAIWIETAPTSPGRVLAAPRIGIGYAGAWAERPLRFILEPEIDWVSRPPAVRQRGC